MPLRAQTLQSYCNDRLRVARGKGGANRSPSSLNGAFRTWEVMGSNQWPQLVHAEQPFAPVRSGSPNPLDPWFQPSKQRANGARANAECDHSIRPRVVLPS